MKTIGKKIKEIRLKNEVSQEELAYQLGVSRQAISKWESDTAQPSTDSIMAICDYFNLPSDYFLCNGEVATNESADKNTVATIYSDDNSKLNNTPNNSISKKKKTLFIGLIVLLSVLLILGIFLGCITLNNLNKPFLGYDEIHVIQIDGIIGIIGIALAVVSLSLLVYVAVLLFKSNNKK